MQRSWAVFPFLNYSLYSFQVATSVNAHGETDWHGIFPVPFGLSRKASAAPVGPLGTEVRIEGDDVIDGLKLP